MKSSDTFKLAPPAAFVALFSIIVALLSGCGKPKKEARLSPDAGSKSYSTSAALQLDVTDTTAAPTDVPVAIPVESAPADLVPAGEVATERTLELLNMHITEHVASGGRIPTTVDGLVQLKLIGSVPKAPPGKKLVVDQRSGNVTFADAK